MLRQYIILSLALLISLHCLNAEPVKVSVSYLGGTGNDTLQGADFLPDGRIVIAGNTNSTDFGTAAGVTPTVWGTDAMSPVSTGFVAILSADGKQIEQLSRFNWGSCYIDRIAVNGNGIYVTGMASKRLETVPNYARTLSAHPSRLVSNSTMTGFAARISLDGQSILAASVLEIRRFSSVNNTKTDRKYWSGKTDVAGIELFNNGDVLLSHDFNDSLIDSLTRVKFDLSERYWTYNNTHTKSGSYNGGKNEPGVGRRVTNDMAISPDQQYIYQIGYNHSKTSVEPYKNPHIFKYRADPLEYATRATSSNWNYDTNTAVWQPSPAMFRLWERTDAQKNVSDPVQHGDQGLMNFHPYYVRGNSEGLYLISDTTGRAISVGADGTPLAILTSDGGASVSLHNPITLPFQNTNLNNYKLPSSIVGGDDWSALGGATNVSVVGRLHEDAMNTQWGWVRMQRFKGLGANVFNRLYDLVEGINGKVFVVGTGRDLVELNQWESGTAAGGVITKLDLDAAANDREFLTHVRSAQEFVSIARNGSRYVTVGKANGNGGATTGVFQDTFQGDEDGIIVVFDDDDSAPTNRVELGVDADAHISLENPDTNYDGYTKNNYGLIAQHYNTTGQKFYLRFDLNAINDTIEYGRLVLFMVDRYGWGDFEIYGLQDSLDGWDETTLTWNNAPGNDVNSKTSLDNSKVTLLDTLSFDSINAIRPVYFEGTTLGSFLESARASGDKKATLIVVRTNEGNGAAKGGLKTPSKESTTPGYPAANLQVTLTNNIAQTYSTWAAGYNWGSATAIAETDDPDGDGITNFMEYAIGDSPISKSMSKMPKVMNDNGTYKLRVNMGRASTEVTYVVEFSTDMSDWSTIPSQTLSGSAGSIHDVTLDMSAYPRLFARVKVSQ